MNTYSTAQFLALESGVWDALATGDMAADERLLTEDFLGVYGSGFSDRSEHVARLRSGPTVLRYELSEARIMVLSDDLVLLSYRADWVPNDAADNASDTMYITSIWRREGDQWRNIFSQDTPAEE
ncbi:MAG TPA: nuclear transport factor 2 family protein [Paucimonas sp.]|nr:nuclear transport factor 2 family protein [Paucimonas sp.]